MPHRTDVVVTDLRAEHGVPLLGLGTSRPRLSWTARATGQVPPAWEQSAYEVRVTPQPPVPGAGEEPSWSSGRVDSGDSVLVPWPAPPLRSRERVRVEVRLWGTEDPEPTPFSLPLVVETGLLDPADWTAVPVGPDWDEDPDADHRPALLRREFTLPGPVARARLHVTAHGLHEVEVNGERAGDEVLAPGWTSYTHRLRYRTHDVTHLLHEGSNALGAWLADGWYRGRFGVRGGNRNLYGERTALIAQLEVDLADGGRVVVATGPGEGRDGHAWRAAHGPILASGLYEGESHDARLAVPGFSTAGFDDTSWAGVRRYARDPATLVAAEGPPVRCTQEVLPVAVLTSPSGATVLDFGQNLTGRLRLRVRGRAGDRVRLRHAEVLQDGELYTRPLRTAAATDTYVLAGSEDSGEPEVWEPRFTMHGFRYAEVTGWPGRLHEGDVVARVHHSDTARTGWFSCSDERLNRLHENVVWSMRSNFVDVPTDCPQRDERLGWTGDIQVFAPTAAFLYDVSGFLASWLRDVAAEQLPDGTVPWYVPDIPGGPRWTPPRPGAVWGDVAVLTPWVLHQRYGDVGVLRTQYDSARAWVDLVERLAGPGRSWSTGLQLGDWLDPAAPPDDPADARTDRYLVATAYFAHSARTLSRIAAVLGEHEDAARYGTLADEVREAFAAEHLRPGGRLSSDAQTAYALAIVFDLLPEAERAAAGERLAELVAEDGNRIATGFAGVNLVTDALTLTGHDTTAHALLTETGCPSWLYQVAMGATTTWERWDSMLPDGTVNPGQMTSFNHYALGSIADWVHRTVAGLAPAAPGYRRLLVRPRPGADLTSAAARHETPYGTAAVGWRRTGDRLVVDVDVPLGVRAEIDLPGRPVSEAGAGRHRFEVVTAAEPAHPPA
ncbi:glycoside hydrolase family 78 protein [Paenibacillus sp. TRM 82003]|uniref:glycoside hydrolase family 78 protein n=1 Tax=Kineococcus sp. TRM81007 TaxID=2925831 RepID=UPI001F587DDC|nr:glycoside hydrolase family 78 protein [Kineococcus sp. TRM81007]MCI2237249.1 glycoside hydrolase family 78 protein [Kineococcus sp. TRM81007]MCI3919308.1 glycoside hydrolase family 78 protein [Paenibacillus sp. TRM 82003]